MGSTSATASGTADSAELKGRAASAEIAKAVVEIVRENNNFDEIEMTCVVLLRKYTSNVKTWSSSQNPIDQFFSQCLLLMARIAEEKSAELEVSISRKKLQAKQLDFKADAEK